MESRRDRHLRMIGMIAIGIGAIGAFFIGIQLVLLVAAAFKAEPDAGHVDMLFLADRLTCWLTKLALILTGILLIRRSRLAWMTLTSAFILSTVDSFLVMYLGGASQETGLSTAGAAGQFAGTVIALALPPIAYLLLLLYLTLPQRPLSLAPGTTSLPPF